MQSLAEKAIKAKELIDEKYLNNPRINHMYGVAKMAKNLAIKYGVDVNKAIICGYMHDYYRYEDTSVMRKYTGIIPVCEECPILYHAYASSKACQELLDINDIDILNAISHHVYGANNMSKLEEIILISDYTEETRKYESCIKAREILLSGKLYSAIYYSTLWTINHLLEKNIKPMKEQYDILETYKEKMKDE